MTLLMVILQDASRVVPRAMLESHFLGGALGAVFLASFLLKVTDVQGALEDDSGYPFLFVFEQSFGPTAARGLATIVVGLLFAGTVSYNLSSSRQVWAVSPYLQAEWMNIPADESSSLATTAFLSRRGSPRSIRKQTSPETLPS
jgi:hypothetical protein